METYDLSIKKLNKEYEGYIRETFGTDEDPASFLSGIRDTEIRIFEDDRPTPASREFLEMLEEMAGKNSELKLSYVSELKEVTLDIDRLNMAGHDYLKELFGLPDYYGYNLDALYDCLSELDDLKVRIINLADVNEFSLSVLSVIDDVADEFNNLRTSYEYDDELIDD